MNKKVPQLTKLRRDLWKIGKMQSKSGHKMAKKWPKKGKWTEHWTENWTEIEPKLFSTQIRFTET